MRVKVMHMIDTLAAAGAERVAVNMVNHLPRDKYVPYLCTTRTDGPLDTLVAPDVTRLRLGRESRFDFKAIVRLRRFLQQNGIQIVHAHSSAVFIARAAADGGQAIVWHAHHGPYALEDHRAYHYRIATMGIAGAITVNEQLSEWCVRRLKMPKNRTWYLPNPVALENDNATDANLPGSKGSRIVCLANFRPEKDHLNLIRAMALVTQAIPEAHLLLVGKTAHADYRNAVEAEIRKLGLTNKISILGERQDVTAILRSCDIGVLSSMSEGLPMSLLEYGAAGLPTVATQVGQCADVLDSGAAGICVPPGSPHDLAVALISLLRSAEQRRELGRKFQDRVEAQFSPKAVMSQLSEIYDKVLPNTTLSRCTANRTHDGANARREVAVPGTTNEEFSHSKS